MLSCRVSVLLLVCLLFTSLSVCWSSCDDGGCGGDDSCCSSSSSSTASAASTAAASYVPSQVRVIGGSEYSFDRCVGVTYGELCWRYVGQSITVAYSYTWSGYIAVGWSSSGGMIGSTAVIGWLGSAPYIDNFDLNSYSGNSPNATTLHIVNASVATNGSGALTLLFTRPAALAASSYSFADISPAGSNVILQSHGTLPQSPSTVRQHAMPPGVDTVTFAAGSQSPPSSLSSTSASLSSSSAAQPTAGSVTRLINGTTYTFDYCKSLTLGELCWLTVGEVITMAYSYQWGGWVGVGFSSGGGMLGSSAVIGWSAAGSSYIDEYLLESRSDGGNSPNSLLSLLNRSVSVNSAGLTTLLFSRPLTLPSSSSASSFASISPLGSNALIEAHGPLPADPSSVSYHGANNRAADRVSFASGAVVEVTDDTDKWRSAHAALMTISFGLLFPLGIIAARFFKGAGPIWFHLHRVFVLVGLALLIAGFAIAINKLDTGIHHTHRGIGIYVFSAMMFQPLNALVRPHPPTKGEQPTTIRVAWTALHHWNARIAYVLAMVNIGIGFGILDPPTRYMVVFWVLWGCVMLTAVALQVRMWVTGGQAGAAGVEVDKPTVAAGKLAGNAPRLEIEAA